MTAERSIRRVRARLGAAASTLGSLTLLLTVWWLLTDGTGMVGPNLLAPPGDVARRLAEFMTTPFAGRTLPAHVAASLHRWTLGVVLATLAGVPLGILMAEHRVIDAAVSPIFESLRFIPPLAWVPLAILWLGTSVTAQAFVVFVAAFPPSLLNAHRAVQSVDPVLRRASRSMGASRLREVLWVVVPTGAPTILAGMSIAMSNGWMALIGAELVGARSGLGFMILRGQDNAAPDAIVAAMVVIGLIGAAITTGLATIGRRTTRWQKTTEATR